MIGLALPFKRMHGSPWIESLLLSYQYCVKFCAKTFAAVRCHRWNLTVWFAETRIRLQRRYAYPIQTWNCLLFYVPVLGILLD